MSSTWFIQDVTYDRLHFPGFLAHGIREHSVAQLIDHVLFGWKPVGANRFRLLYGKMFCLTSCSHVLTVGINTIHLALHSL